MSGGPDSFDPLEQWKADYNRGGIAPLETLNRLAHMSRFIAGYQSRSADAHLALFGLTRDPGYLYLAVQIAGASLDDPIGAAIPLFSSALERAEPGTRWRAALQRGQASVLYTHADATSQVGDLRQAATALAELLAAIPADDRDRAVYAATLANARLRTGRLTGDQETLTAALASFEEAVAGFPPEQPGYAELVRDAARAAAEVAIGDDAPGPFGRALTLFQRAAASDTEIKPAAADDVARLALLFLEQWRDQQRPVDLERSIQAWRVAAGLSDDNAGLLIQNLNNLVATIQEGRVQHDSPGLLDEQAAALGRLVELVPESDPRRAGYLSGLAMSYLDRFRGRHERADIDAAIDRLAQVADRAAPAERRSAIIGVGTVMRERHQWSGELPDVDATRAFWRGLLDATPATDPDHAEWLGGVAGSWVDRYDISRRPEDLDAAVAVVDEALRGLSGRDVPAAYRQRLRGLEAMTLQERYRFLGRGPDLERLVALTGAELDESAPGSPERTARASDHAYFLLHQFYRDRDQGDLNEAIAVLEAAAPDETAMAAPAEVRARWLTLLGSGLMERYGLWGMGQLDEVTRAREYFERAVALAAPRTLTRVEALRGLAAATEILFQLTFVGVGDRDLPVMLLAEALDQLDAESVYAPVVAEDLANRLRQRAASGRRQPGDLDTAIDLLESTVSSGRGGWAAAGIALKLADALRERDQRDPRPGDRDRAIAGYRASLPARLEADVEDALGGAARWGGWAARRRSWAEAAEAFALAMTALDEIYLANVGVGSTVWLRRAPGLAAEAAYAFARAGRPADSALALESARFRAGSESLALVRTDLEELSRAGHADLAGRLRDTLARWRVESRAADSSPPAIREISLSLSMRALRAAAGIADETGPDDTGPDDTGGSGPAPDSRPASGSGGVDRSAWQATGRVTREARRKFDDTVRAIREVPGFERFLDEPALSDITVVSSQVPVVYLASCAQGGLAVALRPGRPAHAVFLRGLRRSRLDAEVTLFQKAYQGREADPAKWRAQLTETTRWLWDAVMARTLSLLDPAGQVLLIPTGTLGVLPLHAAWRPDAGTATGRGYACDHAVISYAPNARSAGGAPVTGSDTLLAVADPAPLPAPLAPVTFAEPEVAAAAAWFPEATVLRHEEATGDQVRRALASASVCHLACHGRVDLSEPRRSALVLSGGEPLTIRQLLGLRLRGGGQRLAVLTACESALAGSALPDEVISLPGVLLQAGFSGAVATQWAVSGLSAAFLTARFYQHWRRDNWDWATSLAAAQRWLRDSTDGEKAEFAHPRDGMPLLPVAARRPLWRAVASRDPAGRSFAHVADWAAYTFVGGTSHGSGPDTGT